MPSFECIFGSRRYRNGFVSTPNLPTDGTPFRVGGCDTLCNGQVQGTIALTDQCPSGYSLISDATRRQIANQYGVPIRYIPSRDTLPEGGVTACLCPAPPQPPVPEPEPEPEPEPGVVATIVNSSATLLNETSREAVFSGTPESEKDYTLPILMGIGLSILVLISLICIAKKYKSLHHARTSASDSNPQDERP